METEEPKQPTMKPRNKATNSGPGFPLVEALFLATIALVFVITLVMIFIQPVMESRTYNKLTGAHTTWWDAVWVELRVQGSPNK